MEEIEEIETVCCIFYDDSERDLGRIYSTDPYFMQETFQARNEAAHIELQDWFKLFPRAAYLVYLQDPEDGKYLHTLVRKV
jgi:hypothetical protein